VGWQYWRVQELLAKEDDDNGAGIEGDGAGAIISREIPSANLAQVRYAVHLETPWSWFSQRQALVLRAVVA
jgi:hypothetical protein